MGARTLRLPVITPIEYKGISLIIMDSPSKSTVPYFVEECRRHNVSDIVRVCEDRYPTEEFEKAGIKIHHWEFSDGSPPPDNILTDWFNLLRGRLHKNTAAATGPIAVHCVAGYGRAPVLVAVALMELGMPCADAIELIRNKRSGAFNDRQLAYLTHYHAKSRLRKHTHQCVIA
ncbi:Tyrosine phosphatase type IVA 2 [Paragonimus heterotremus]|uniref:protein-tyrosine-phosphatase n=1 Tax=Paragonimus heterotremus TaxID=100268 RepID=A0A8J4TDF4_9TREM|nr:Tyrosine phosphatase type IVA 2 [Paragonimus heterotremus]